ncbi:MAG: hypothetical protein KF866_08935 [Phycisphaeraceae bacterium]|nr:hypothetical protein [Phycisphaeraceae bacterium]MCW5754003.1 hypothetical protein [Phycisphaeraceae bacterium]
MVLAILGIIAAIAVPRMEGRAQRARAAALVASLRVMQESVERYRAEHEGRTPAHGADGAIDSSGDRFGQRLTQNTNADGLVTAAGLYGPYLRTIPINPLNKRATVRINGVAAGAGTHGWRFDVARSEVQSDHLRGVEPGGEGEAFLDQGLEPGEFGLGLGSGM